MLREVEGNSVAEACKTPHFHNVRAVAVAIANEGATQIAATLEQRDKVCVEPPIQWFLRKFNVELYDTVSAFKAARVMCPVTVQWLRPTPATVDALGIFPFLNSDATINGLIRELPQYFAAAQEVVIQCEEKKVVGAPRRAIFLLVLRCQEDATGSAIFCCFRESF